MITLRCAACKEHLTVDHYFTSTNKRGFQYTCKICMKTSQLVRRGTVEGRLRHALTCSKTSAKHRNIFWDLKLSDLQDVYTRQKGLCAISGVELTFMPHKRGTETAPTTLSVDRINNDIGYVSSNIQLVTHYANVAKNKYSMEDLIQFCRNVLNTHKDKE